MLRRRRDVRPPDHLDEARGPRLVAANAAWLAGESTLRSGPRPGSRQLRGSAVLAIQGRLAPIGRSDSPGEAPARRYAVGHRGDDPAR